MIGTPLNSRRLTQENTRPRPGRRFVPRVEGLEHRLTPAAPAHFDLSILPGQAQRMLVQRLYPNDPGFFNGFFTGLSQTVVVVARDQAGGVARDYRGTIRFTTTDPSGVVPAAYTFTGVGPGNDNGVHQFVDGLTFNTASTPSWTVTATDTSTPGVTGSTTAFVSQLPQISPPPPPADPQTSQGTTKRDQPPPTSTIVTDHGTSRPAGAPGDLGTSGSGGNNNQPLPESAAGAVTFGDDAPITYLRIHFVPNVPGRADRSTADQVTLEENGAGVLVRRSTGTDESATAEGSADAKPKPSLELREGTAGFHNHAQYPVLTGSGGTAGPDASPPNTGVREHLERSIIRPPRVPVAVPDRESRLDRPGDVRATPRVTPTKTPARDHSDSADLDPLTPGAAALVVWATAVGVGIPPDNMSATTPESRTQS